MMVKSTGGFLLMIHNYLQRLQVEELIMCHVYVLELVAVVPFFVPGVGYGCINNSCDDCCDVAYGAVTYKGSGAIVAALTLTYNNQTYQ